MKNKIKAMVMAAGMGSRLEPITLMLPKPLIPIMNRPIMDIILEQLHSIGVDDVISNTYYLADQIIDRYKNNDLGINFNYIKETELSGTAGGVKKCQFFFDKDKDFIVMSGDVLTTADLQKGLEIHRKTNAIATIGVKQVPFEQVSNFGVVVTDNEGFITGFQEKPSQQEAKSNLINTGIYIFNYKIFDYIPENTFYDFAKNVFPALLKDREINTFEVSEYWNDVGTISQYKQSIKDVFDGKCKITHSPVEHVENGKFVTETSDLSSSVCIKGNTTIGRECKIGEHVTIENCVVFDGAEIPTGMELSNCIVLPSRQENDEIIISNKKDIVCV